MSKVCLKKRRKHVTKEERKIEEMLMVLAKNSKCNVTNTCKSVEGTTERGSDLSVCLQLAGASIRFYKWGGGTGDQFIYKHTFTVRMG